MFTPQFIFSVNNFNQIISDRWVENKKSVKEIVDLQFSMFAEEFEEFSKAFNAFTVDPSLENMAEMFDGYFDMFYVQLGTRFHTEITLPTMFDAKTQEELSKKLNQSKIREVTYAQDANMSTVQAFLAQAFMKHEEYADLWFSSFFLVQNEVARSNNTKIVDGTLLFGENDKVLKPENVFEPPEILKTIKTVQNGLVLL